MYKNTMVIRFYFQPKNSPIEKIVKPYLKKIKMKKHLDAPKVFWVRNL